MLYWRLLILSVFVLFSSCITWHGGALRPYKPSYGYGWVADVSDLSPEFRWQAYVPNSGETNVRYQFELMKSEDYIIFAKDDIVENHLKLPMELTPGKVYYWKVRPVFEYKDQTIRRGWNRKNYFWFLLYLMGVGSSPYAIRVDRNAVSTVQPDQQPVEP